MKKIIFVLILLTTPAIARPYYNRPPMPNPSSNISAYDAGYNKGRFDQKITTEKAIVATAVIALGAVIIYKVITAKPAPINEYGKFSVKF